MTTWTTERVQEIWDRLAELDDHLDEATEHMFNQNWLEAMTAVRSALMAKDDAIRGFPPIELGDEGEITFEELYLRWWTKDVLLGELTRAISAHLDGAPNSPNARPMSTLRSEVDRLIAQVTELLRREGWPEGDPRRQMLHELLDALLVLRRMLDRRRWQESHWRPFIDARDLVYEIERRFRRRGFPDAPVDMQRVYETLRYLNEALHWVYQRLKEMPPAEEEERNAWLRQMLEALDSAEEYKHILQRMLFGAFPDIEGTPPPPPLPPPKPDTEPGDSDATGGEDTPYPPGAEDLPGIPDDFVSRPSQQPQGSPDSKTG